MSYDGERNIRKTPGCKSEKNVHNSNPNNEILKNK